MIFNMTSGTPLNFKVNAYASELLLPATASVNTIAVFTSNEMTGWVIDANEPAAPEEGMVWIIDGTASNEGFNALKTNSIKVYPIFAKQYIGGAWVKKSAKIYQNGEFEDFWNGRLFDNGNQFEFFTGGWEQRNGLYQIQSAKGTVTIGSTIYLNAAGETSAVAVTKSKMNFAPYKTLFCDITANSGGILFALCTIYTGNIADESPRVTFTGTGVKSLDISGVTSGDYYLAFGVNNGRSGTVSRIWLE